MHMNKNGLSTSSSTRPSELCLSYSNKRQCTERLDEAIQRVDAAEAGRDERPVRQALVQVVAVTDRPLDEAAPLAERLGIDVATVLDAPFVLIGSIDQLVAKVEANRARWGITSYIIRQPSADDIAPLVGRL